MATVTLSDGRTLSLRPMYIREKRAIIDLQEATTDESPILDYTEALGAVIEPAVSDFDGSIYDMTEMQLLQLINQWSTVTEDDAIPPENGTGSETT